MNDKGRNKLVDIIKGILIIFVIFGHISKLPFFDWFHMPIFFMISGYLIKLPEKKSEMHWIVRRTVKLIIPYVSYYFLFVILKRGDISITDIINVVFSGKRLVEVFGVWWFPVCLLISSVILVLLLNHLSNRLVIIMTIGMYFFAIIISNIVKTSCSTVLFYIPWNLDVCLIAVPYMLMGYYLKKYEPEFRKKIAQKFSFFLLAIFVLTTFIFLDLSEIYNYNFRMKYSEYTNFILPILIPIAALVVLYKIAEIIKVNVLGKIISEFGEISMVLMYTHNFLIEQLTKYYEYNNTIHEWFFLLILCLLLGYIWSKICNVSKISKILFVNGKVGVK